MEEVVLFLLAVVFGGFAVFVINMCCIRLYIYLKDNNKLLCFNSKAAQRRRQILLSLPPEVNLRISEQHRGYTPPPDEDINEDRLCSGYIYADGRSIGMRMLPNLPAGNLPITQPINRCPDLSQNLTFQQEPPPPDYREVYLKENCIEMTEPPPPRYDECIKIPDETSCLEKQ